MSRRPGVSVVIPTYNRAELVMEAVRSALEQTWEPLEVIVVDDASSDDTVARLERLAEADSRVRVIAKSQNGGESAARNEGTRAARYPYVAFLDSDNTFSPDKLERQLPPLLLAGDDAVSFTGYRHAESDQEWPVLLSSWSSEPDAVTEALLQSCCVNTSTFVAPRTLLLARGLFREDLRCCEDHELWLRLSADGSRFLYEPEPLTRYRFHSESISADEAVVAAASEEVIGGFLERDELPSRLRRRRSHYRARWALNSAGRYLEAGEPAEARRALVRASLSRPLSIRPGWARMAAQTLRAPRPKLDGGPMGAAGGRDRPGGSGESGPRHALVFSSDGNEGFTRGLAVSLHTALTSLSAVAMPDLYILDCGISPAARERLTRVVARAAPDRALSFLRIDPDRLARLPANARFPPVVYSRLLIPEILPSEVTRAVFLDADLIIRRDLSELLSLDLGGAPVAGVRDFGDGAHLDGDSRPYFNAGVLVIDPVLWRKRGLTEAVLEHIETHERLPFQDQDALNATIEPWHELDYRWNLQLGVLVPGAPVGHVDPQTVTEIRRAGPDGLILHFTVAKPWIAAQDAPDSWLWIRAGLVSGWDPTAIAIWRTAAWMAARARLRVGQQRARIRGGRVRRRRARERPAQD